MIDGWLQSKQLEVASKALKPTTPRPYVDLLKPTRERYGAGVRSTS